MRHFYLVAGVLLAGPSISTETQGSNVRLLKSSQPRKADNCDSYCVSLNGDGDYCKDWSSEPKCHQGGQPCGKGDCGLAISESDARTTPAPTTVTTTREATEPQAPVKRRTSEVTAPSPSTTSVPQQSGECENMPSASVPASLWIENNALLGSSTDAAVKFYEQVLAFVKGNCARVQTTKLIVRVYHPEFPSKDGSYYAPSTESVLFTELLQKLPSNVQVHFYPYVMDTHDQEKWAAYGGSSDVMANVFKFTGDWNKVLASAGAPLIRGLVLDNEEVRGWSNYKQMISESNINALKSANGNLDFGISIGFDETPKLDAWSSFVDEFYLQAYDFYSPTALVGQTSQSRFLTMQNDAASLAEYVDGSAIAQAQWDAYAKDPSRVTLMWSTQELSGEGCLYPLADGTCGVNHEFGSWSPSAFNEFLRALTKRNPTAAAVEHAIFQFSFMPKTWMPRSARN